MDNPKNPLLSRTLWVNAVSVIACLAAYYGFELDASQQGLLVAAALGLVNLWLRMKTKQPLGKNPNKGNQS